MHRDLKGANLLVNNRGELKITDFGLARPIEENRLKYTPGVVTRWYRPSELLFGSDVYNESIDIWGAGCIIAEMYIRKPLFGASSDLDQLKTVCMYCGTPTEETYPGVNELPDFSKIQLKIEKRILKEYLESKKLDKAAVDLIDKMLVMDPKQRITAQQALEHDYFKCEPLPCLPSEIGQFESSHVYTVQQQKEKEQQQKIENEPKRRRHDDKEPRSHNYNDHDSRHSVASYNRNEQLKYGEPLPPPPPPPPTASTLRDRHASSREDIGREVGHHHGDIRRHNDDHRHHNDYRHYDRGHHHEDYRHHNHDYHARYSDSYGRHYDDSYRNHESRNHHYRQDKRKVEYNESRSHHTSHEDIGKIESKEGRIVFNGSGSRSSSPEKKTVTDISTSGTERSRRSISYDDL